MSHKHHHILLNHVNKNEHLPTSHIKSLVQMAQHGNQVRDGKHTKQTKDSNRHTYRRDKYKCFLCNGVVVQLHMHLQKVHNLTKTSSHHEKVALNSRRYDGRAAKLC